MPGSFRTSLKIAALGAIAALSLTLCGPAAAGFFVSPSAGSNSANASGWLAGAHAGYNWTNGSMVYGFETDLSKTNLDGTMNGGLRQNGPNAPAATDSASTAAKIDWYGTLRGRLGVTNGPFLVYGTAGLAYGTIGLSSRFNTLLGAALSLNQNTASTRVGWVAGAGAEYLLRPDLSLTLAYQYVDLRNLNLLGVAGPSDGVTAGLNATARGQFHTVSAGFSWHFPANGWGGWYGGGQAGGAWGNGSSATYSSSQVFASDARLKRDITLVGRRGDGLGVYSYRYLGDTTVYVGVMAQEVALIHPSAVVRDPLTGLLAVDYRAIGMQLMTLSDDARL